MWLGALRADNFRLLAGVRLRPHPRLNLVIGPNAAGKTSLLETVYTLGRGKSFRGNSPADLAGAAGRQWQVAGEVAQADRPGHALAVSWSTTAGTELRQGMGTPATTLDLVRRLPVQILEPGMHRLLQDGPSYRRSFLDWGVFHVEQDFYPFWRRFQRALRQRNGALRAGQGPALIRAWNDEAASAGEQIQARRQAHVEALQVGFGRLVAQLLDVRDWALDLHPGWSRDESYETVLEQQLARDQKAATTVEGPHRAELRIKIDAHSARNRVSRGQQKLLIAALLLAQAELIGRATGQWPLLLVDDFCAELAEGFQRALLTALTAYPGQVWVTSFERAGVLADDLEATVFHVEQGRVSTP